MNRRSTITHITPLPSHVSRDAVLALLHDHSTIITLNPLVTHHGRCTPPAHALPDEQASAWYEITDKIEYIPGTGLTGSVTYTACLHDTPNGLQTHIHAPAGLEIRGKWQLLGWLPGEKREVIEISAEQNAIPKEGLYLREDSELKCNFFLAPFVKRNLHKSHKTLVKRLLETAASRESSRSRHAAIDPSDLDGNSRTPTGNHDGLGADREQPQFDEQRQRAVLELQAKGYSVSVSGGTQRNLPTSHSSQLDRTSSLTRRGRSQSPGYSFVKTTLGSSKRYPSEGAAVRYRNESPASAPSTGSSRGASLGRSLSKKMMKDRDTPLSSRQGTPEVGELTREHP